MRQDEKNLEERLADTSSQNQEHEYRPSLHTRLTDFVYKNKDSFRKYLVDTSASLSFFMPLAICIEHYVAHIDSDHVA